VSPSRVGGDRVRLVGSSTPSSRWSTAASVGSCRKFLVGISRRLDRLHKLCRLLPHASDFEECDTNEQREGPEKVSGDGKHQEVVQSAVKVAMVIMASIGGPTGMPVALVLEINFFEAGRDEYSLGWGCGDCVKEPSLCKGDVVDGSIQISLLSYMNTQVV